MSDNNIQSQIDALNSKMDIILEEVIAQRSNRQQMEDLVDDMNIIGKDAFANTVQMLDRAGVELDYDEMQALFIKFVRNIGTFSKMMDLLENVNDLFKDLVPIINQVGLDTIAKFGEFEQKGYLDFAKELISVTDRIVEHFTVDDVNALADNVVTILETVKNITQPDMLGAMNNALLVYKSMDSVDIPEYSMFKAIRKMNSPEMKRGIGFMITFMDNLSTSMNKKAEK